LLAYSSNIEAASDVTEVHLETVVNVSRP